MSEQKIIPKKYIFDDSLIENFPQYMQYALGVWSRKIIIQQGLFDEYRNNYLSDTFMASYQIATRKIWPSSYISSFLNTVLSNKDEALFFLQTLLNGYGDEFDEGDGENRFGEELETILASSGSAYTAKLYQGEWMLMMRVPESVKCMTERAISSNELLMEAWKKCYGVKPDYNRVVQQCIDVLERTIRDHYLPGQKKPQLGKDIRSIEGKKDLKMNFKGFVVLDEPKDILLLIKNLTRFRGEHTGGTGVEASKDVAEYAMLTTIYFWNLHN